LIFSARVQTVHQSTNPAMETINKFKEKNRLRLLVNTSFNVRGDLYAHQKIHIGVHADGNGLPRHHNLPGFQKKTNPPWKEDADEWKNELGEA